MFYFICSYFHVLFSDYKFVHTQNCLQLTGINLWENEMTWVIPTRNTPTEKVMLCRIFVKRGGLSLKSSLSLKLKSSRQVKSSTLTLIEKHDFNLQKTKWVYICKHLFSWTEKGLHQHTLYSLANWKKGSLFISAMNLWCPVIRCQQWKHILNHLKKFPALIKCISSGDKKIHKEGNENKWHLIIGGRCRKKVDVFSCLEWLLFPFEPKWFD